MSEDLDITSLIAPDSDFIIETPPEVSSIVGDVSLSNQADNEASSQSSAIVADGASTASEGEQPTAAFDTQAFLESIGGETGAQALASLLEAEDPTSLVQQILSPEQQVEMSWGILESNKDVILQDPDVQAHIAESFGADSIDQITEALEFYREYHEPDPEVTAAERAQRQERYAQETEASNQRVMDFHQVFFVDTAAKLAKEMGLTDSEEILDRQYAAQGRFLAENQAEYIRAQGLFEAGKVSQGRMAAARLHNKLQAHLIRSFEKASKSAPAPKAQAAPKTTAQPTKAKSGSYGDAEWLREMVGDFREERQKRGL